MNRLPLLIAFFTTFNCSAAIDLTMIAPPNGGKGTIGDGLSKRLSLPRLSSGDIVRAEINNGTEFGKAVRELTQKGGLIADESPLGRQLFEKVRIELAKPKYANGVILDGYPRTLKQAVELKSALSSMGRQIEYSPHLQVPREVLIERSQGRLSCPACKLSYHRTLRPPKIEMQCDRCCGLLVARADDDLEVVLSRIATYEGLIPDVLKFYHDQGSLIEVDGTAGAENVIGQLQSIVDPSGILDRDYLKTSISSVPGLKPEMPRFYNIVEIYENPPLMKSLVDRMSEVLRVARADYIVAPEARGWGLAGSVSVATGTPMIAVRKAGKLPKSDSLLKIDYSTAYSNDSLEMVGRAEYENKTAVIIDDGNSSGGTALAVRDLLNKAGIKTLGVITAIKYHYRPPLKEYQDWLKSGAFEINYYDLD